MAQELVDVEAAVRLGAWRGDAVYLPAAQAFATDFYSVVEAAGVSTQPDPFDADLEAFGAAGKYAMDGTPDKSVGGQEPVVLTICIFVSLEVAGWAIEQVSTSVWQRLVPSLARLLRALRERPESSIAATEASRSASCVVLRTVYGPDQVVVEIAIPVSVAEPELVARLAADAQGRALTGATGNQIARYRIADGGVEAESAPLPRQ